VSVSLLQPQSGIVDKEKRLVGDEAASEAAAELIQPVKRFRSCGGKEIARVEPFVAVELEERSVQLVGATLGHHVNHAARGPAELGRKRVGLDAHFLDGVYRRPDDDGADEAFVVVEAVDQEVV